jgi:hypothetical protein
MPGGEFCEEEELLPGHITVSINSFCDIVMYVHMCACDCGKGEGGRAFLHTHGPLQIITHHIP